MVGATKSFKFNGSIYDVPEERVADFIKRKPEAQEVQSFIYEKDTFDVPVDKVSGFLERKPDAKPLYEPSIENPLATVDTEALKSVNEIKKKGEFWTTQERQGILDKYGLSEDQITALDDYLKTDKNTGYDLIKNKKEGSKELYTPEPYIPPYNQKEIEAATEKLKKGDNSGFYDLGNIELQQGNNIAAQDRYMKGLANNPDDSQLNYGMGYASLKEQDLNTAEEFFNKTKDTGVGANALAYTQMQQGKYDEALKTVNSTIDQFPDYEPTYVYKAKILEKQGKKKEAKEVLETAKEINDVNKLAQQPLSIGELGTPEYNNYLQAKTINEFMQGVPSDFKKEKKDKMGLPDFGGIEKRGGIDIENFGEERLLDLLNPTGRLLKPIVEESLASFGEAGHTGLEGIKNISEAVKNIQTGELNGTLKKGTLGVLQTANSLAHMIFTGMSVSNLKAFTFVQGTKLLPEGINKAMMQPATLVVDAFNKNPSEITKNFAGLLDIPISLLEMHLIMHGSLKAKEAIKSIKEGKPLTPEQTALVKTVIKTGDIKKVAELFEMMPDDMPQGKRREMFPLLVKEMKLQEEKKVLEEKKVHPVFKKEQDEKIKRKKEEIISIFDEIDELNTETNGLETELISPKKEVKGEPTTEVSSEVAESFLSIDEEQRKILSGVKKNQTQSEYFEEQQEQGKKFEALEIKRKALQKQIKSVHESAKQSGIDIESKEFMDKSEELTGERHLDNMTAEQLTKVKETINNPPLKEAKKETGIRHEATGLTAKELGLEEREISPETVAEWDIEADKRLRENPSTIPDLLTKLENGGTADKIDQRVLLRHMASLEARIRKNPSDELIAEYDKVRKLSDVQAGSEAGRTLKARQGAVPVEDSLAELLVAKKESAGVEKLTDKQKSDVTTMFEEYQQAKAESEAKIAKLEEANARLLSEKEFNKEKRRAKTGRKTHEEHVAYREKITGDISAKLKAIRGEAQSAIVPYARELIAITPDVIKLMKDHIEEKVTDLGEIVKNIHTTLKPYLPEIQEKDIRDIIAGKYNEVKKTRSELAAIASSLKSEAILIGKLEALENGEIPKSESKRVQRNQKIAELRKQIKDADITKLQDVKKRNEQDTKRIEDKIANKEYVTEKKVGALDNPELRKRQPKLFNEALDSLVKKQEAREKLDVDRYNDRMAKRGNIEKTYDYAKEVINISRMIVAGVDDSAIFIQNALAVLNPLNIKSTFPALKAHALDAISTKRFKRELARLHNSEKWDLIEKSGVDVLDSASLRKQEHEETFKGGYLTRKIKGNFEFNGKSYNVYNYSLGIFERGFISLGNNLRVNLFLQKVAEMEADGKTFATHPQEFKDVAQVVNSMTARGKLPKAVEMSSDLISPVIWSPKLIGSSLDLLGFSDIRILQGRRKGYYTKLTGGKWEGGIIKSLKSEYKSPRGYAISQSVGGISMGIALMYAAKLGGADVDDDPTSVTFSTVQFTDGGDRFNIFGRFTPYVRQIAMQLTGKKTTEKGTKILGETYGGNTKGSEFLKFTRGKVTPAFGVFIDWRTGKRYDNSDFTWSGAGKDLISPFVVKDIIKGLEQNGMKALLTRGVPSFIGIKVSNKKDFKKNNHPKENPIEVSPLIKPKKKNARRNQKV